MSVDSELSDAAASQTVSLSTRSHSSNGDVNFPPSVPVHIRKTETDPTYSLCEAKYDFFSEKDEHLNFKKGDLLYIINVEGEWWYARAKQSGQEGYIPHNSVADLNSLGNKE